MKKSTQTSNVSLNSRRMHGNGNMNVSEKAKDFKGTAKRLIKYLSEYKISIFVVLIFAVISTVFTIIGPKVLGQATTELYNGLINVIAGRSKGINFDHILKILLFLLFVLADITDYKIFDCSTSTIASEIEKDDYTNAEKYVMMLFADK